MFLRLLVPVVGTQSLDPAATVRFVQLSIQWKSSMRENSSFALHKACSDQGDDMT